MRAPVSAAALDADRFRMISLVGISHRTAPVALREQVSLRAGAIPAALQRICTDFPGGEWVLLSTCNRTELYAAGVDTVLHKDRLVASLVCDAAHGQAAVLAPHFYVKKDTEALRHLYAVASSLDALVVGETEVLGQVKQALALAEEAKTAGKVMTTLFQTAFRTAKRIHTETDICRGHVSVSSLAVEFAEKLFGDLTSRTAMIVGAGETAERALKSLVDKGIKDVLVLNRSHHHGRNLARCCGGRAYRFELLDNYLTRADIVISSTSAPHSVIGAEAVQRAMAVRAGRPLLLIDIAVPRDVDPAARGVKNVHVCTIDDLERIAAENLARRQAAVDRAWQVVDDELSETAAWCDDRGLRTLLRTIDEHGRQACDSALQRAMARKQMACLPEAARKEVRELSRTLVRKLLAQPRAALKRAARSGQWDQYHRVASDLFGLDPGEPEA